MVRLGMARRSVGERQAEANLVYGDKLGSFERSFKSTRQRKLYLLRLLMKQFIALQRLINDFAFPHQSNTELSAKESSSAVHGGARTTSWINEIVMHGQLSAVPRSSAMSLTTMLEEQTRANKRKVMEMHLTIRKLALKEMELAEIYRSINL